MGDGEKRTIPLRTKLTPTQAHLYDGIANKVKMADDLLVHKAVMIGLTEIKKGIDGASDDPRLKLWQGEMDRADRKDEIAALAKRLDEAEDDEQRAKAEALCREMGYELDKVRASIRQEQTKDEREIEDKKRSRCRSYLVGLLTAREDGLATSTIIAYAKARGYPDYTVRRSLEDVAVQGTGFWYLPDPELRAEPGQKVQK